MGRAIKAGAAYVELSVRDKLQAGLQRAQRRMRNFGRALSIAGVSMAGAFVPAIKAASDMQETMAKFGAVFGDNADAVKAWADAWAQEVGRSKRQVADFLASTQDLFVPLGFDSATAEGLSKQLTQLAVDLASFNNKADADVLRDLHAALTGSSETVKKYGVIVSEAAVKQELLNQAIDPKIASEQQKVMARLNIIMRGTTAAQGDATRTASSFANQMKALKAKLDDAAVAIGTAVLPAATKLVGIFSDLVNVISPIIANNKALVVALAATAGGLTAVGLSATAASVAIGGFSKVLAVIAAHPVIASLVGLGAAFGAFGAIMQKLTRETAELATAQRELLAEQDNLRSADNDRLNRLQMLAQKEKLTNAETQEAATLAKELQDRYGALGIDVDKLSGKLNVAADAQDRLNAAQREAAIADVNAALKERFQNLEELQAERASIRGDGAISQFEFFNSVKTIGTLGIAGDFDHVQEALDAIKVKEQVEFDGIDALMARLKELDEGSTVAIRADVPNVEVPVTANTQPAERAILDRLTEFEARLSVDDTEALAAVRQLRQTIEGRPVQLADITAGLTVEQREAIQPKVDAVRAEIEAGEAPTFDDLERTLRTTLEGGELDDALGKVQDIRARLDLADVTAPAEIVTRQIEQVEAHLIATGDNREALAALQEVRKAAADESIKGIEAEITARLNTADVDATLARVRELRARLDVEGLTELEQRLQDLPEEHVVKVRAQLETLESLDDLEASLRERQQREHQVKILRERAEVARSQGNEGQARELEAQADAIEFPAETWGERLFSGFRKAWRAGQQEVVDTFDKAAGAAAGAIENVKDRLGKANDRVASSVETRGTFSAFEVAGLSIGTNIDRDTLEVAKEQLRELEDIRRGVNKGGQRFA